MALMAENSTKPPRRKLYLFKRREIKNEYFIAASSEFSAAYIF